MESAKLTNNDPLMPSMYPEVYSLQALAKPAPLSGPSFLLVSLFPTSSLAVSCRRCAGLVFLKGLFTPD